jgi:hypothetical protein
VFQIAYTSGNLSQQVADGRVYNTNVTTASTTVALRYEYAIRDHLGNTPLAQVCLLVYLAGTNKLHNVADAAPLAQVLHRSGLLVQRLRLESIIPASFDARVSTL